MSWQFVSDASVNFGVHVFFQISVFTFFRYIPRSEMFTLEQKVDLYGVKKKIKINRGSIKKSTGKDKDKEVQC